MKGRGFFHSGLVCTGFSDTPRWSIAVASVDDQPHSLYEGSVLEDFQIRGPGDPLNMVGGWSLVNQRNPRRRNLGGFGFVGIRDGYGRSPLDLYAQVSGSG